MKRKSKVVSIGNISLGGTGKTPHTIEIANEYLKRGEHVAVLSLGYRGKLGYGLNVISDGKMIFHKPPMAADEPYMIAQNLPKAVVITGKKRHESLFYAEDHFGTTFTILDDAFQYHKIEKDAEILLIDHKNPISTGFPFPFGYLRELPSAIKRADIIIFTRAESEIIPENVKKYIEGKPIYFSNISTEKIVFEKETILTSDLANKKVVAYSAVASNDSFRKILYDTGCEILFFNGYRDHAQLSDATLKTIVDSAKTQNADYLLTTEKDYVKQPLDIKKHFGYLKLDINISNKEQFYNNLDNIVKKSILS